MYQTVSLVFCMIDGLIFCMHDIQASYTVPLLSRIFVELLYFDANIQCYGRNNDAHVINLGR